MDYIQNLRREFMNETIHSVLERRAIELNDKIAVYYGPKKLKISYAELNNLANRIGNYFRDELGIKKGETVTILMQNPLLNLYLMFALSKIGAIYAPVNFRLVGPLLSYVLNDLNSRTIVLEKDFAGNVNEIANEVREYDVIVVDEEIENLRLKAKSIVNIEEAITNKKDNKPNVKVEPSDSAAIIYTSGTTGRSKGVLLPHRYITLNYGFSRVPLLKEDDVIYTCLPWYHVAACYFDTYGAIAAGAQVALWDRFSPSEFWNEIRGCEATTVTLLSVMIAWLMKSPYSNKDRENTLNKVHMQPLPDNYKEIAERFGFDFITVGFGQTESGAPIRGLIEATSPEKGTPEYLWRGKSRNEIIQIVTNSRLFFFLPHYSGPPKDRIMGYPDVELFDVAILDEDDNLLPPNNVGELAVRPKIPWIMFKEYYNNPEKTLETFRNLWFHTGDAVYVDENGIFYYVDRIDDVIRRRGENISSFEVEDLVMRHPKVQMCAAFPLPAEEGGEDEVAIAVKVKPRENLNEEELREFLKKIMPKFMAPKYIFFVEDMPATPTGKIEKYKLKKVFEEKIKNRGVKHEEI